MEPHPGARGEKYPPASVFPGSLECSRTQRRLVSTYHTFTGDTRMCKREEHQLITRVGPGTSTGNFMRECWVPGMLSSALGAGLRSHFRFTPPLTSLNRMLDLERFGLAIWLVDNQHISEGK